MLCTKTLLTVCALGLFAASSANARDWPRIAPPPHARVENVASDMIFNGLPMRVRQFHTTRSSSEVLKFYQHQWHNHYVLNTLGPWQVVGRELNGYYASIQIKPDGRGAKGLIGVTALSDIAEAARLGHGFARMQDSRIINDIVSHDLGKTARTLILSNRFSISSNALFYQQRMKDGGWHEALPGGTAPSSEHGSGRVLNFHRGNESAIIIIGRKGGQTAVVVNLVRRGG